MKRSRSPESVVATPSVDKATLDFLSWVAERIAPYREAWEVWQTTCPRQSTWEDSFIEGLVQVEFSELGEPIVVLTPLGRSILGGCG